MLIEVDSGKYRKLFPSDPHPFIGESFIAVNRNKADTLVHLVDDIDKPDVGLVAGVVDGILKSPFSAPFGGFHFRKEIMYINKLDNFVTSLKEHILLMNYKGIELTLPPDIYHSTFNAKVISALIRDGYKIESADITNWIDLKKFSGAFTQRNSREYLRQAIRNGLTFDNVTDKIDKQEVYNLISENRARFDRPIYMSFNDIEETGKLWPVDYFKVCNSKKEIIASAIFYQNTQEVCYAVFWGDNEDGRPLRAMDFLSFNLWSYYKTLGYHYIDLGVSTESGIPNEGLLRFKESHDSVSSIRYRFSYYTH